MSNELESKLQQFDAAYEQAEVKGGNTSVLPPGKYDCQVTGAEIFESKEGRLFMKVSFKVLDGGQKAEKIYSLDTPERFGFIKGDLATLGFFCKKISEIPAILSKLGGISVNVTSQQKGEYTNYFFNAPKKVSEKKADNVPW